MANHHGQIENITCDVCVQIKGIAFASCWNNLSGLKLDFSHFMNDLFGRERIHGRKSRISAGSGR